eukprot:TRINITY_DN6266_c0_g1_i2.p1 TRINITY_DN6266_c0_g1~~TRINITY_DN6266_c0_g1_i2.p1  ORF type:complete len:677 (-),score=176.06 TRINITY_DN6266_c0_g1_i2:69-2099(-)
MEIPPSKADESTTAPRIIPLKGNASARISSSLLDRPLESSRRNVNVQPTVINRSPKQKLSRKELYGRLRSYLQEREYIFVRDLGELFADGNGKQFHNVQQFLEELCQSDEFLVSKRGRITLQVPNNLKRRRKGGRQFLVGQDETDFDGDEVHNLDDSELQDLEDPSDFNFVDDLDDIVDQELMEAAANAPIIHGTAKQPSKRKQKNNAARIQDQPRNNGNREGNRGRNRDSSQSHHTQKREERGRSGERNEDRRNRPQSRDRSPNRDRSRSTSRDHSRSRDRDVSRSPPSSRRRDELVDYSGERRRETRQENDRADVGRDFESLSPELKRARWNLERDEDFKVATSSINTSRDQDVSWATQVVNHGRNLSFGAGEYDRSQPQEPNSLNIGGENDGTRQRTLPLPPAPLRMFVSPTRQISIHPSQIKDFDGLPAEERARNFQALEAIMISQINDGQVVLLPYLESGQYVGIEVNGSAMDACDQIRKVEGLLQNRFDKMLATSDDAMLAEVAILKAWKEKFQEMEAFVKRATENPNFEFKSREDLEQQVNLLRKNAKVQDEDSERLKRTVAELKAENRRMEEETLQLNREKEKWTYEADNLKRENEFVVRNLDLLKRENSLFLRDNDLLKSDYEQLRKSYDNLRRECENLNRHLDRKDGEINDLKRRVEGRKGAPIHI